MGCSGLPHRNPIPAGSPFLPNGWRTPVFGMLHAGLIERPDLSDEPIWHCPAMGVNADTLEYTMLYADGVEGAPLDRHLWSPAYRDIHRALRVERRAIENSIRRSRSE